MKTSVCLCSQFELAKYLFLCKALRCDYVTNVTTGCLHNFINIRKLDLLHLDKLHVSIMVVITRPTNY